MDHRSSYTSKGQFDECIRYARKVDEDFGEVELIPLPPYKKMSVRMIQLRTNHMVNKSYLARIGKLGNGESANCSFCNAGKRQTREHLMMRCPRYRKAADDLLWRVGVKGPRMIRQLKRRQWYAQKLLKEARSEDLWVFVERTDIGKRTEPKKKAGRGRGREEG
jgi:hypothetical protein